MDAHFNAKCFNRPIHIAMTGGLLAILAGCGGGSGEPAAPDTKLAARVETMPGPASASVTGDDDFSLEGHVADPDDTGEAARESGDGGSDAKTTGGKLYVSAAKGSDSNPGTEKAPFRTIGHAARFAGSGTTVHVAPGTYEGGFQTTASGTANARIRYVSTKVWGAKIVPPASSGNDTAWDNRGSYVDIVGFEVSGAQPKSGKKWTHGIYNGGSNVKILRNHVMHIAQNVACTSAGGSAIGVDSYYKGVNSHVVGNLVHDIGPKGCRYVQGIYVSTSGSVKNNQVYRVSEGAIHLWHDARNVVITGNTVADSNTGIIVGGGDYYHTSGPNDNTRVFNNIVYDNKMGISEQGQTGRNNKYGNNLAYKNSAYNWQLKNGLSHTNTVSSEPYFAGYRKQGYVDFQLTRSSPAIGRGTLTDSEKLDFNGKPRNTATGVDIGAYQYAGN